MRKIDYGKTQLNATAAAFIASFLRFEFALKEARYSRGDGPAKVDWRRVADALGNDFWEAITASRLAATILDSPPKQQWIGAYGLEWRDSPAPTNTHELFLAVRRIRNNLFHGGKSGDPEFDTNGGPSRSTTLLSEAHSVIEQALLKLEDVRLHFEGKY